MLPVCKGCLSRTRAQGTQSRARPGIQPSLAGFGRLGPNLGASALLDAQKRCISMGLGFQGLGFFIIIFFFFFGGGGFRVLGFRV